MCIGCISICTHALGYTSVFGVLYIHIYIYIAVHCFLHRYTQQVGNHRRLASTRSSCRSFVIFSWLCRGTVNSRAMIHPILRSFTISCALYHRCTYMIVYVCICIVFSLFTIFSHQHAPGCASFVISSQCVNVWIYIYIYRYTYTS